MLCAEKKQSHSTGINAVVVLVHAHSKTNCAFIAIFSPLSPTPAATKYHPERNEKAHIRTRIKKRFVAAHDRTSLTGPLTFLMMDLLGSSMNSTLTWITFPVFPVRPSTLLTLASLTLGSCKRGATLTRYVSATPIERKTLNARCYQQQLTMMFIYDDGRSIDLCASLSSS